VCNSLKFRIAVSHCQPNNSNPGNPGSFTYFFVFSQPQAGAGGVLETFSTNKGSASRSPGGGNRRTTHLPTDNENGGFHKIPSTTTTSIHAHLTTRQSSSDCFRSPRKDESSFAHTEKIPVAPTEQVSSSTTQ
jgi:hypothetical protein